METTEGSSGRTFQTVVEDTLKKADDEAKKEEKQTQLDNTMLEQINSSMYNYKEALDNTLQEIQAGGGALNVGNKQ